MLTKPTLAACAVAAMFAVIGVCAGESGPLPKDEVLPLIVVDDVPLCDAIRNITRRMDLNFIFDPCVPGASPSGSVREPGVNIRLENQTVEYALNVILKNHGLTLISNPVTTVARIVPLDHRIKPVPPGEVRVDTNVVPLVVFNKVPLRHAIESAAREAKLKVVFHSSFLKSQYAEPTEEVYVRWTNLTVRQTLTALLDNYDLALADNPTDGTALITLKAEQPGAHGKNRPWRKRILGLF